MLVFGEICVAEGFCLTSHSVLNISGWRLGISLSHYHGAQTVNTAIEPYAQLCRVRQLTCALVFSLRFPRHIP